MEIIFYPSAVLLVASLVLPWGKPFKWGVSAIALTLLTLLGWGVGVWLLMSLDIMAMRWV